MTRDLLNQPRSLERPLSPLCRAFGLAAVAAELNLQLDTLAPATAKAIELTVRAKICGRGLKLGDSLAVNGCCLTVVKLTPRGGGLGVSW